MSRNQKKPPKGDKKSKPSRPRARKDYLSRKKLGYEAQHYFQNEAAQAVLAALPPDQRRIMLKATFQAFAYGHLLGACRTLNKFIKEFNKFTKDKKRPIKKVGNYKGCQTAAAARKEMIRYLRTHYKKTSN